jgi:biotin synthase
MQMNSSRLPDRQAGLAASTGAVRSDWTMPEVAELFRLPLHDLLYRAHSVHRAHFDPAEVQISTLMSIKTGGCPEDCGYCPQSVHFDTGLTPEVLVPLAAVIDAARTARDRGATRFCMGAAYRSPKPGQLAKITEMVRAVHDLGLETCATLGMLTRDQAESLRDAGLDYYNHNLDTSEAFYPQVISTRTYADRLDTLKTVRDAGLKVCCGGIIGLGEADQDRIELLHTLATLPEHPESVPVNQLVQVEGTPLEGEKAVDPLTFVRVIAVARILMPRSRVRLSAGRTDMSDELQALCFFAGANSIFYGEQLLTTPNPAADRDMQLLARLGLRPASPTTA